MQEHKPKYPARSCACHSRPDWETTTLFLVGHKNSIARGALLLVSDLPMTPEGIKTETSDRHVTEKFTDLQLDIGIEAMTEIDDNGEQIKHFTF